MGIDPFVPFEVVDKPPIEMSLSEPCEGALSWLLLPPWSLPFPVMVLPPFERLPAPPPPPPPDGEDNARENPSRSAGRPFGGAEVVGETSGDDDPSMDAIRPMLLMIGLPLPLSLPLLFLRIPVGR